MNQLARLVSGLLLWAAGFALLYGLHGIGCAEGWDRQELAGIGKQRALLGAAWLSTLAAGVLLALWLRRGAEDVIARAALWLGWAGVGATLVGGLSLWIVPACL